MYGRHPEVIPVLDPLRTSLLGIGEALVAAQGIPAFSLEARGIPGGAVLCFSIAYHLGELRAPSTPWFHFIYTFIIGGVMVSVALLPRLGATTLASFAALGGCFGLHPQHLSDPLASMAPAQFSFVLVLCHALGLYSDNNHLRLYVANLPGICGRSWRIWRGSGATPPGSPARWSCRRTGPRWTRPRRDASTGVARRP